jgi:hypothetical protein
VHKAPLARLWDFVDLRLRRVGIKRLIFQRHRARNNLNLLPHHLKLLPGTHGVKLSSLLGTHLMSSSLTHWRNERFGPTL